MCQSRRTVRDTGHAQHTSGSPNGTALGAPRRAAPVGAGPSPFDRRWGRTGLGDDLGTTRVRLGRSHRILWRTSGFRFDPLTCRMCGRTVFPAG